MSPNSFPTEDGQVLFNSQRFKVVRVRDLSLERAMPERDVIRHPGAVTILPLLPDQQVCLIRNRRLTVGQSLLELPAGTLEPGESPETTARRELIEETGFEAQQMEPLHSFYVSPGILDERIHVFVGRGLSDVGQHLEPDERIVRQIVSLKQAVRWAYDGTIVDAKTIAALLIYDGRTRSAEG